MSAQHREPSDREPGAGERVRFCLTCGEVLAFDVTRCPACGTLEAAPAAQAAAEVAPCPACGESKPASLLFCPHCGVDVGAPAAPKRGATASGGPALPVEHTGTAVATLALVLSIAAPLGALLVVLDLLLPGGLA